MPGPEPRTLRPRPTIQPPRPRPASCAPPCAPRPRAPVPALQPLRPALCSESPASCAPPCAPGPAPRPRSCIPGPGALAPRLAPAVRPRPPRAPAPARRTSQLRPRPAPRTLRPRPAPPARHSLCAYSEASSSSSSAAPRAAAGAGGGMAGRAGGRAGGRRGSGDGGGRSPLSAPGRPCSAAGASGRGRWSSWAGGAEGHIPAAAAPLRRAGPPGEGGARGGRGAGAGRAGLGGACRRAGGRGAGRGASIRGGRAGGGAARSSVGSLHGSRASRQARAHRAGAADTDVAPPHWHDLGAPPFSGLEAHAGTHTPGASEGRVGRDKQGLPLGRRFLAGPDLGCPSRKPPPRTLSHTAVTSKSPQKGPEGSKTPGAAREGRPRTLGALLGDARGPRVCRGGQDGQDSEVSGWWVELRAWRGQVPEMQKDLQSRLVTCWLSQRESRCHPETPPRERTRQAGGQAGRQASGARLAVPALQLWVPMPGCAPLLVLSGRSQATGVVAHVGVWMSPKCSTAAPSPGNLILVWDGDPALCLR